MSHRIDPVACGSSATCDVARHKSWRRPRGCSMRMCLQTRCPPTSFLLGAGSGAMHPSPRRCCPERHAYIARRNRNWGAWERYHRTEKFDQRFGSHGQVATPSPLFKAWNLDVRSRSGPLHQEGSLEAFTYITAGIEADPRAPVFGLMTVPWGRIGHPSSHTHSQLELDFPIRPPANPCNTSSPSPFATQLRLDMWDQKQKAWRVFSKLTKRRGRSPCYLQPCLIATADYSVVFDLF